LQTALAASVDLRCYGLSTPRHDGKLSVTFADIGGFAHEWEIDELPWHAVAHVGPGEEHPEVLHQQLLDALDAVALPLEKNIPAPARAACLAFLYLYMMTASAPAGGTSTSENGSERPALHFAARSTLPIGAGLGSSASFSVCAASAVLLVHGRITPPAPPAPSRSGEGSGQPGHVHISHQGRRALPTPLAEEVNRWAFVAEKILHGTPSGVDNSVAVYGGALAYTKGIGAGRKNVMEPILGFKSLRFLLTDSKVPRDTKALVAGVGAKKLAVGFSIFHVSFPVTDILFAGARTR
jgi:mevalonate kinase